MKSRSRRVEVALPSPGVRFAPDFVQRLERLVLRVSAARERREGAGGGALAGAGEEFVGYRPYRPGEDLRMLDWNLYARLDRPYVRATRREAAERWSILVDASASMGVGSPGKLQAAAEATAALAAVGARLGAEVRVQLSGRAAGAELRLRRARELPGLLAFLESVRAGGERGLAALLAESRVPADVGRAFVVGDLVDVAPRDVLGLARRGRELFALQVLAPIELAPPRAGEVEWRDPEGSGALPVALDAATVARYERALEERLETWRHFATRHGMRYACTRSDRPFEDTVRELLAAE